MADIWRILLERGYIAGYSEPIEEVQKLLAGHTTIYQGFDPTAPSLHLGHLESLMIFHHLQQAGHRLIFLIGGVTALVGDPSGRDEGRPLLTQEEVQANARAIQRQVQTMGLVNFQATSSNTPPALLLNNADWLDMGLIAYLREVTVHFSVNEMLRQETFARRLADQRNLSLLELLYPTLQAYDFLYLFDRYGCQIQMGGVDQWGNIVDGIELVRRTRGKRVHALVFPLLLDQHGQKMGKTSSGQTIWLAPERTSPFAFYQYWLTCPDADLKRNLKMFTFLPIAEIERIAKGDPRQAQHRLAYEVTMIVHGQEAARRAQEDAQAAFSLSGGVPRRVPTLAVARADLEEGLTVAQALRRTEVVPSLAAARRLIQQGGVRLNGIRLDQIGHTLAVADFREWDGELVALVQHGRGKVLKLVLNK